MMSYCWWKPRAASQVAWEAWVPVIGQPWTE
jgi:hypothetical protein